MKWPRNSHSFAQLPSPAPCFLGPPLLSRALRHCPLLHATLSLPILGTVHRVQRGPGAWALLCGFGIAGIWFLSHLQMPTHWTPARSRPQTHSPVGTGVRGVGWWTWAPPPSGLAELSVGPGDTLTHPLWLLSSCGEPDAADSWRAGLPGTQFCLRRGWVHFNNFISPAHTLCCLILLFCLPHHLAALLS